MKEKQDLQEKDGILETHFEKISDVKRSAKFTQLCTIFYILK